jgi:hypothetical protein
MEISTDSSTGKVNVNPMPKVKALATGFLTWRLKIFFQTEAFFFCKIIFFLAGEDLASILAIKIRICLQKNHLAP